ncbi:hypothetical protein HII36_24200 [Nonomuraea sp. NN258]|nr:hypothetical protein [Nonomuraea antri]
MAQPGDKRGLAFAVIVVVIAAVGIYVTWMGAPDEPVATTQEAGLATGSPAAASSTPLATASSGPFDVYSYLPLTKEQLAAAADLAERFTAAYGTFRFDEDPAVYAERVKAFTTAELGTVLTRTLTSAGTVEQNKSDQLVSTGAAKLKEIRQVDKTSVVFVVAGTRQILAKSGNRQSAEEYAVTVTQLGADWRVFDIQPAGEGQDGDVLQ